MATVVVTAALPGLQPGTAPPPEAAALMGQFRAGSRLESRLYFAQDVVRQEIVSGDFVLPAGTLLLHRAGDRYYAVADPKTKTYAVLDAETLLSALEGGIGIENNRYQAQVRHTPDKKVVAGVRCRRSLVTVTYVSSIPFESERVLVQQKNESEVWHTADVVAPAALGHFFLNYRRDLTGDVHKVLAAEIGFPMEIQTTVTFGAGKRAQSPPGTVHMTVTEVRQEKALDAELFRLPPAGYAKTDRLPQLSGGR